MFGRKSQQPTFTVSAEELRRRFDENILIIGDFSPRRPGGQKHSVLGPDRKQITLDIADKVIEAIIGGIADSGGRLEPDLASLYLPKERRRWAGNRLGQMARFNYGAESDDPFDLFHRSCGKLTPTGYTRGQRRLQVYAVSGGLLPLEAAAAISLVRTKLAMSGGHAGRRLQVYALIQAASERTGLTPEEGYIRFCDGIRAKVAED
jgi:hypothetical protein